MKAGICQTAAEDRVPRHDDRYYIGNYNESEVEHESRIVEMRRVYGDSVIGEKEISSYFDCSAKCHSRPSLAGVRARGD